MKRTLFVLGVTLSLVTAAQGDDPKSANDVAMGIIGSWKVVKFKSNGKPKDDPIGAIVTFDGKTMTLKLPTDDVRKGPYKLDTSKSPVHFDLTVSRRDEARRFENICKLEGDTLTIVFNERRGPRPTKFDVGEGDNYELIVLKPTARDSQEE